MPETGLWQLRIHYGEIPLMELVDFIKSETRVVLIVRETDANRPHIHCVITEFKQTKSTFCQHLLKKYPTIKGNASYSCEKKKDYDAQLRYCCKGLSENELPDVLYNEIDNLSVYHEAYWVQNSLLKAKSKKDGNMGLQKDTSLVVKAKSKTWTERVYDEILLQFPSEIATIQTFQMLYKPTDLEKKLERDSRMIIFRYMMKAFGKAVKKISHRIIQETFDGYMNDIIQLHSEAGEKYSDKIFNQIYK